MIFEDKIAEGKRLIEGAGVLRWKKRHYVRGWCRWGRFCAASAVDPVVRPSSALIPRRHLKAGRVQAAEWCLSRE